MWSKKVLRGVSKGQVPEELLVKAIQDLSKDTVVFTGRMTGSAAIVERWNLCDGFFEIEFSELALAFIEGTNDPRAEKIQEIFDQIDLNVH